MAIWLAAGGTLRSAKRVPLRPTDYESNRPKKQNLVRTNQSERAPRMEKLESETCHVETIALIPGHM